MRLPPRHTQLCEDFALGPNARDQDPFGQFLALAVARDVLRARRAAEAAFKSAFR